ncbi:MAG: EpsI family protein [Candidatus Thiodiazotropha taylori]|nr:EpsI family protein [Candidatus Thiodiazotropha taylori]MCW4301749.1 EpsI family protein [Candidatus Thiodiazotropha endolucinida]MCG8075836.1 EpsI family protein [Candidatus Thiodiazotropha taylori]MCG8117456.1 EpsI family protein [Candidatus Thiodiazotropha taylori]MCW4307820.1 EpsI family protein [Candidatus Thiodiazotropha endolucinida]
MSNSTPSKYYIYDLSLFLGILVLFILYHTTAISIYNNWTAENSLYSHGLLLLPISFYLFLHEWKLKRYTLNIEFRPFPTLILIFLGIFWYISESIYIQIASQILFILIISFYIYSLFGFKQTLRLSFPVLILLSSVPLWFLFSEPLQTPTAILVDKLLKLTGYTSYQEGYYIHIPEGIFEVGDTCSGLRYQIAAVTTAAIYIFYYNYSVKASILCILFASLIAFLSNSIRIYIVVLSGHYTNMTHSLLEDHIWLGWAVFGIFFMTYLIFLGRIDMDNHTSDSVVKNRERANSSNFNSASQVKIISIFVLSLLASSTGPLLIPLYATPDSDIDINAIELNPSIQGWNRTKTTQSWRPIWQQSDFDLFTSYSNNSGNVDLFIGTFVKQSQGKELISDLNIPYDMDNWELVKTRAIDILLDSGKTYTVAETIVSNQYLQKRIIWNWFYIDGKLTHEELSAKLVSIPRQSRGL